MKYYWNIWLYFICWVTYWVPDPVQVPSRCPWQLLQSRFSRSLWLIGRIGWCRKFAAVNPYLVSYLIDLTNIVANLQLFWCKKVCQKICNYLVAKSSSGIFSQILKKMCFALVKLQKSKLEMQLLSKLYKHF